MFCTVHKLRTSASSAGVSRNSNHTVKTQWRKFNFCSLLARISMWGLYPRDLARYSAKFSKETRWSSLRHRRP